MIATRKLTNKFKNCRDSKQELERHEEHKSSKLYVSFILICNINMTIWQRLTQVTSFSPCLKRKEVMNSSSLHENLSLMLRKGTQYQARPHKLCLQSSVLWVITLKPSSTSHALEARPHDPSPKAWSHELNPWLHP